MFNDLVTIVRTLAREQKCNSFISQFSGPAWVCMLPYRSSRVFLRSTQCQPSEAAEIYGLGVPVNARALGGGALVVGSRQCASSLTFLVY